MHVRDMNRKSQQALSLEKKQEILNEVKNCNASKSQIAAKFGIAKSTLSTILKNREKIEAACTYNHFDPARKRMRTAKNEDVEIALMNWVQGAQNENIPLTGVVLQEKARFFADTLNVTEFQCSSGWLHRFKDRYNIGCKRICSEERPTNMEKVNNFLNGQLATLFNSYAPCNIFNMDQTGLFWRAFPDRTLFLKGMNCSDSSYSQERLTVVAACNMDGTEKLPLLVIGKFTKPQCFKNIKTMPVNYENNNKAWMNAIIFTKWLKQIDREFLQQSRKVCLLLENCSVHCYVSGLKAVKLVFVPRNASLGFQSCNHRIIKCMKLHYRAEMIRRAIQCHDQNIPYTVTLLDALIFLRTAWRNVSPTTIRNCFYHVGFVFEEIMIEETAFVNEIPRDMLEAARMHDVIPASITFEEYVSMDDDVITSDILTKDTKIVDAVGESKEVNSENISDEVETKNLPVPVSSLEAFSALETVYHFVMEQSNSFEPMKNLDKLQDFLRQRPYKKRKQHLITEFFKTNVQ